MESEGEEDEANEMKRSTGEKTKRRKREREKRRKGEGGRRSIHPVTGPRIDGRSHCGPETVECRDFQVPEVVVDCQDFQPGSCRSQPD
jgi:hypothetical protein